MADRDWAVEAAVVMARMIEGDDCDLDCAKHVVTCELESPLRATREAAEKKRDAIAAALREAYEAGRKDGGAYWKQSAKAWRDKAWRTMSRLQALLLADEMANRAVENGAAVKEADDG